MSTASETQPMGTFACPICGVDTPHYHPPEQVAAYRDDQARGDGWTSTAHRQPKQSGWYLCLGVEVDPDQYGEPKDIWDNSYDANRWRQLSWFRWVRDAAAHHVQEAKIQEVLYFERSYGQQRWQLRNFLGNAVPSGAESRFPVHAQPKYWRDLLDAPTPPGGKSDQGEKEKPTISSGPVPETMVDAAFKAAAGRMSRKQTRHVLRQALASYPPAGGEGKPEREVTHPQRGSSPTAGEGRPTAAVNRTEPLLSRSGDSALVEAVALLKRAAYGGPNVTLAEIDKFLQQHGERR